MPRTKLAEAFAPKDPPVNWLWAIILERMKVKHYTVQKLASAAGCSYDSMRHYINADPWSWPYKVRESVCEVLGVNIIITPKGVELEERK